MGTRPCYPQHLTLGPDNGKHSSNDWRERETGRDRETERQTNKKGTPEEEKVGVESTMISLYK